MKYLLLLHSDPTKGPEPGSPEQAAQMKEWFAYTDDLVSTGKYLGGEALHPPDASTTVKKRDGKTITADGPFAETKEVLGGFYLIEADDLDDAISWAEKIPNVGYGTVELRPVMEFDD